MLFKKNSEKKKSGESVETVYEQFAGEIFTSVSDKPTAKQITEWLAAKDVQCTRAEIGKIRGALKVLRDKRMDEIIASMRPGMTYKAIKGFGLRRGLTLRRRECEKLKGIADATARDVGPVQIYTDLSRLEHEALNSLAGMFGCQIQNTFSVLIRLALLRLSIGRIPAIDLGDRARAMTDDELRLMMKIIDRMDMQPY